jgi:hypothetical protein
VIVVQFVNAGCIDLRQGAILQVDHVALPGAALVFRKELALGCVGVVPNLGGEGEEGLAREALPLGRWHPKGNDSLLHLEYSLNVKVFEKK